MTTTVTLEDRAGIAVLRLGTLPLQALSMADLARVREVVHRFAALPTLRALVISVDGVEFAGGSDAGAFPQPDLDRERLRDLMNAVEALDRPVVAALRGEASGVGLELALACHWRVASQASRLAFPEVFLGALPCAGGTQRLTRLVGPRRALDLIATGRSIDADAALACGLLDEVVAGDPLDAALALAAAQAGIRRTRDLPVPVDGSDDAFFDDAEAEAARRRSAHPSAVRIVQCVRAAARLSFDEGSRIEATLCEECLRSPESSALRYLYFAQREASRIPGLAPELNPRAIVRVGVVGSGTMGGGIAMNFANVGIPTRIVDNDAQALARGLRRIRDNYETTAAKGRLSMKEVEERMALLQGTLAIEDLADCDLVIEAVFENLAVKREVCAKLGQVCKPGAIIASNTSTLDIDLLGEASGRPGDFLGLHFFSPANVMKLLEVVRGAKTSPDVLITAMSVARTIGKVAVVSGVCYGFIGNRMLESYLRETDFLLLEGATPAQIDGAIEGLGLAMGPCRMLDLAGPDVAGKIVLERGKAGGLPDDPSYRAVVVHLLETGRHGQKTGSGYYRYQGRNAQPDPDFTALCRELAGRHGIAQRSDISDQEIIERCLYPLINEGARIIEEGIACRGGDVDVVWTQGYGFPDYRGGPLFMADSIGLDQVVATLDRYAAARGDRFGYWTVSPLLRRLARDGGRLSEQRAP